MKELKIILESNPNVKDYDNQPYAYINALQNYVKKLEEAINYTHSCNEAFKQITELKYKEEPTLVDYIKENRFKHKIYDTYLDEDGYEWSKEEIKILMNSEY